MKICFIGKSGHVQYTFQEMQTCSDAQFVGIAPGSDHEDVSSWKEFGIQIFDSYEKMLDDTKPDVAVVSPVFGLTGRIILACAKRKIDVFAEKPIAATLEELNAVESAVKESGIHFCAMHYLRYEPTFYHARKLVHSGEIGEIKMISAQKSYIYGTRPVWFQDRDLFTGTIPWVGSHAVDWLLAFTGKNFLKVNALHNGNPEMVAHCQFLMEDQIIATVSVDYFRPSGAPTHDDDRLRIVGTKGIMEVSRKKYTILSRNGIVEYLPEAAPKLAVDFLLRKEEITAQEVFAVTRASLAARDSADTGKEVII